jgi:hypothetical protein
MGLSSVRSDTHSLPHHNYLHHLHTSEDWGRMQCLDPFVILLATKTAHSYKSKTKAE